MRQQQKSAFTWQKDRGAPACMRQKGAAMISLALSLRRWCHGLFRVEFKNKWAECFHWR